MALGSMGPARLPVALRPNPGNLRYGLFNVAPPQTLGPVDGDPNFAEHALGGGLVYDPKGCGEAHLYEINCDTPASKPIDANSPEVEVLAFVVYATLACGPYGYTTQYMTDKTGERLFANEQHAVEAALWTGSAGNLPRIDDPVAAVDVGAGGAFANIVDAVAALEQHAYGTVPYGYNAVLHAQTAVHAYAAADYLVQAAGTGYGAVWGAAPSEPILRTSLGTKWVFGGGYPGTGPDGIAPGAGETYIWITGNVTVWRDKEWTPPDQQQVMNRTLNQYQILAERGYLATYDCFHAYALVSIPKAAV